MKCEKQARAGTGAGAGAGSGERARARVFRFAGLFVLPWCLLLMAGYYSGTETVVTAGTPVQLSAASPAPPTNCITLTIAAKTSNAGTIYIGGSNVSASNKVGVYINSSFPAAYFGPSSTSALYVPSAIWLDATNSGDGVAYTCTK